MSVSRRDFMKLAGLAGAAGVAGVSTARASSGGNLPDDGMGMLTDLTLCVGCRKCEWACKDANNMPDQKPIDAYDDKSVFLGKRRTDGRNLTVVNRYPPNRPGEEPVHVKTQCMHCLDPACQSACLVHAFRKTDKGPVVYDESICIGCRYCMVACPFEIPAYTYDSALEPAVKKCTMCFERIKEKGGRPACAAMCPVEAITFGKRRDLLALARDRIAKHPGEYVDHVYGEHEAGGTSWLYIAGRPFDELGFRTNVGTTPYPQKTAGFDAAVPLILTIWPALLTGAYAFTKRREELACAQVEQAVRNTRTNGDGDHG